MINAPYYKQLAIMRELGMNNCVDIKRGSHWGNPFVMEEEHERDDVCDMFYLYAQWRLKIQPDWLEPLRGKHLLCCCAPRRCHGDTLIMLANRR